MKYEAIDEHRRLFSMRKMCSALGVKESNYYRWRSVQERQQKTCWQEKLLVMKIEELFSESRRTYGYRKMQSFGAVGYRNQRVSCSEDDAGERFLSRNMH